MPFVHVITGPGLSASDKDSISRSIHESLMEAFTIPQDDFFQVIQDIADRRHPVAYLGVTYTDNVVFIQITARGGRTPEQKKKLYALIASKISARTSLTPEDVFIVLHENTVECWSFGNGIAQYL